MTRFKLWRMWMLIACASMIVFGLLMVFFNQHPLFRSINAPIHDVFWPQTEISPDVLQFQRWVYGTWGATIAGMGVLATYLAYCGFWKRIKWTRDCLGAGILFWYIFDTAVSVSAGVMANAISNTVILISFALPIILTWKDFQPPANGAI